MLKNFFSKREKRDPAPVDLDKALQIVYKTEEQIAGIRESCQLAKRTLDSLDGRIQPGITTRQINDWVHSFLLDNGAQPATLGYRGFPASVCTSINYVVCHGIPGPTHLRDGDIVNVDVTAILNGYYGDTSRMYLVGEASPKASKLADVTLECLWEGIEMVRPGNTVGDIGWAIESHAHRHGYTVVQEMAGHGVGLAFHEDPVVLHFGERGEGILLAPNMTFTIEPMINSGRRDIVILADGWTVVTADRSLSAQWEHTVCVTETGVDVLTL